MTTMPTVTALYGSLNAILNIVLASQVSRQRGKAGVSIGEGGSKELALAMRIHGNNAEFVPLAIIVMLLAELCGGASMVLHIVGGSLLVARIFHVIGMPRRAPNFFRFVGVAATWLIILGVSIWTLILRSRA